MYRSRQPLQILYAKVAAAVALVIVPMSNCAPLDQPLDPVLSGECLEVRLACGLNVSSDCFTIQHACMHCCAYNPILS